MGLEPDLSQKPAAEGGLCVCVCVCPLLSALASVTASQGWARRDGVCGQSDLTGAVGHVWGPGDGEL